MDENDPKVPTDEVVEDLEADEDADQVLGGAIADPDEGGEYKLK